MGLLSEIARACLVIINILFLVRNLKILIINLSRDMTEMSNNVVCTTSKASDQPAHTRSLSRAFASRLNIL